MNKLRADLPYLILAVKDEAIAAACGTEGFHKTVQLVQRAGDAPLGNNVAQQHRRQHQARRQEQYQPHDVRLFLLKILIRNSAADSPARGGVYQTMDIATHTLQGNKAFRCTESVIPGVQHTAGLMKGVDQLIIFPEKDIHMIVGLYRLKDAVQRADVQRNEHDPQFLKGVKVENFPGINQQLALKIDHGSAVEPGALSFVRQDFLHPDRRIVIVKLRNPQGKMVALAAGEAQIGVADIHGGKIGFVVDHVVHQIGGFNQTFIVFQHLLVIARIQQHLLNAAGGQQQVRSILHISDNIVQILVRQRQQIFGQLYHFAVHHLGKAGIGDHTEKRHGEYQQQSDQNGKFIGDGLLTKFKHKSLQKKQEKRIDRQQAGQFSKYAAWRFIPLLRPRTFRR